MVRIPHPDAYCRCWIEEFFALKAAAGRASKMKADLLGYCKPLPSILADEATT